MQPVCRGGGYSTGGGFAAAEADRARAALLAAVSHDLRAGYLRKGQGWSLVRLPLPDATVDISESGGS